MNTLQWFWLEVLERAVDTAGDIGAVRVFLLYGVNPLKSVILESVLTCPSCGHERQEIMPTDACQYFYECTRCKTLLKPKAGDCCVFCSYGSVACPPIQEKRSCCR